MLILLALQLTRFERAAEGVTLPAAESQAEWRDRSEQHARVVEIVADRQNWVEGFKRIEQKLGFFREDLKIAVTLEEWDSSQAALGGGDDGEGNIKFNMKTLAAYQHRIDEFEALQKQGPLKIYVPPTQIKRTVWHELTHVYQDNLESPEWFREGMACLVEGNESVLRWFAYENRAVKALGEEPAKDEVYARGWLFWLWLEEQAGAAGVKQIAKAACGGEMKWSDAVAATLEMKWEAVLEAEREWSAEHVGQIRKRMGL